MPRPVLAADQIASLRNKVAEAVFRISEDGGTAAVTMRSLAREVEMSPMGLYRYFPGGKNEVVEAARSSGFRALARELESVARRAETAPIAGIRELATAAARFALERPARYRLMFDLTQEGDSAPDSEISTARSVAWAPVRHLFADAVAAGELVGDPDEISHLFVAAVHGAIVFELSGQPYRERRLDQTLPALVETLLSGLAHPS